MQPDFLQRAEEKAFSRAHRETMERNIGKYNDAVAKGKQQFADLERARQIAKNKKWAVLENLPDLLLQFEKNFTQRGGKVIWARTAEEANDAILDILEAKKAKTVVKSKSMITEEIELNALLEGQGVEVLETDLGEFIVQLLGQKPYHIVTPAMHLNKQEIARLFHERFSTPADASPEELTLWVRQHLRPYFAKAEVGITGGNFLIADTGTLVLTENEGNARLSATLPATHIAIVGIEKVLASIQDLDLFLPLLATHGTGQPLTVYNTLISAPRQSTETAGPDEIYLILLDNGRSDLLADAEQREALYCIRCGACLNACPVYRTIGGHAYDAPYGGPIGSVIMPYLNEYGDYETQGHLSHASSLCGNCATVCPVRIDLPKLLLNNRERMHTIATRRERWMWSLWQRLMRHPRLLDAPRWSKRLLLKLFVRGAWGKRRSFPDFPEQSFRQMWKKGAV